MTRRRFVRQAGEVAAGAAAAAAARVPALHAQGHAEGPVPSHDGATSLIRLDQARNPDGPSARVLDVLRDSVAEAAAYAHGEHERLTEAIARMHGVDPAGVVLGCGSSDLLRAAARAFAGPARPLVMAVPTCGVIADAAEAAGAEVRHIPLRHDFSHDLEAMRGACGHDGGLVYLCNPNSPTGTLTQARDVDRFFDRLPATVRVVVDEAYFHYVEPSPDYVSSIARAAHDPRAIVVRTFSKVHGLAGLRAAYAVAAPATAAALAAERLDSSLSLPAARAALAALADGEHLSRSVQRNADNRQEFQNQVNARMLRSIDSQASFVFLESAHPAASVVAHFRAHGIVLADPIPGHPRQLRIPIGTAGEMATFWQVWDRMPGGPMLM